VKEITRYLALFCIILTVITHTRGQDVRPVAITKYTQREGLSSYYITKIIQDKYGFFWVGTQEGLNIFDGNHFDVLSRQSDSRHRLGGSLVSDIAEDKARGWMWVLTTYGDICAIDINTRTVQKRIREDMHGKLLANTWIRCLHVQGDTLWIAGLEFMAAYDLTTNRYLDLDMHQRTEVASGEFNISRITVDAQHRMWIGSEGYGVTVLNKQLNLLRSYTHALNRGDKFSRKLLFWDMVVSGDKIYAGTSWGLQTFRSDTAGVTMLEDPLPEVLKSSEIQSLALAADSMLIFSTPSRVCTYQFSTGALHEYRDQNIDDDWLTSAFQIVYEPVSRKTWVGTQTGLGSFSTQEIPFRSFSRSIDGTIKLKHLYALLPLSDTNILAGDENGLYNVRTDRNDVTRIDTASANLMLFKDRAANVFISNKNGLYLLKDNAVVPAERTFPALRPVSHDHLGCAIQFNDSLVLFSSIAQKGLWVWNTRSGALKTFHNDSIHSRIEGLSIINYLHKAANGRVYILTEKSIISFDPVTGAYATSTLQTDAGPLNNFMDMTETQDHYWIATYGNGLIKTDKDFDVQDVLTLQSGLSNNCVYRVFSVDDRMILLSTNNGLSRIDTETNRISNYYETDGLHASEFEQFCAFQGNGRIYAGGVNGFTMIDPVRFVSNTVAPRLYITGINVETPGRRIDTCQLKIASLVIPNDVLLTTIRFSAINYTSPSRIRYAYRIGELNDEWIGLDHQNFVNLMGLSTGSYTFEVKASNEDGVWSTPIKIDLVYLPKWYETRWFKFAIILSCLLVMYGIFQYRLMGIKKQQQIRKELANDLHDDIGSILNTLKIFTHLAKKTPDNRQHLDEIEKSVSTAALSLRDMIWVLDDALDTPFELMDRIRKFASPVCEAQGIQFIGSVDAESNILISKTEKRNLLLIAKESINNAIKYASCSQIRVSLIWSKKETQLVIQDNGQGFDLSKTGQGNGLLNIRYRASQIAYVHAIQSFEGKGTTINLSKRQ
jgi:ligand-binding sensor domain-containing protein/two-component sensor histidine kinase